jgi:hypothetical protein
VLPELIAADGTPVQRGRDRRRARPPRRRALARAAGRRHRGVPRGVEAWPAQRGCSGRCIQGRFGRADDRSTASPADLVAQPSCTSGAAPAQTTDKQVARPVTRADAARARPGYPAPTSSRARRANTARAVARSPRLCRPKPSRAGRTYPQAPLRAGRAYAQVPLRGTRAAQPRSNRLECLPGSVCAAASSQPRCASAAEGNPLLVRTGRHPHQGDEDGRQRPAWLFATCSVGSRPQRRTWS